MRILINEDSRNDLLSQGKKSRQYSPANQSKGKNRYERRTKSRILNSTKNFNNIDMNKFFKDDILELEVPVQGETSDYVVKITFAGTLTELHKIMGDNPLELKWMSKALYKAFSGDDVYISCSCKDWHYRMGYWATVNNIINITPELRPNQYDWTNKSNDMGPACKHVLLVLSDSSWLITVARVIINYAKYTEEHRPAAYQTLIYPAIYDKEYEDEVQLDLFGDNLEDDEENITRSNKAAIQRGRFQKGWNDANRKNNNDESDEDQITMDV